MVAFFESQNHRVYRLVLETFDGVYMIDYAAPKAPFFVSSDELKEMTHIPAPDGFFLSEEISEQRKKTKKKRLDSIQPLLKEDEAVINAALRLELAKEAAASSGVSARTVQNWYYAFLARGEGGLVTAQKEKKAKPLSVMQKDIRWALNKYLYSSRRMPLKSAYDMLLLERYTKEDGTLKECCPTFSQFRYYYYKRYDPVKKAIAQKGLSHYQRNVRPLYGKRDGLVTGVYEMDATEADIYIVSKLNRKQTIGRPIVYLAVDVASKLIAGIYVGLSMGEEAVIECLRNAAADKVSYCAGFGIDISPGDWPSSGLPAEIVTDRGREFLSGRTEELCTAYGITLTGLPPYRPDLKGTVEKTFDIIQNRYKSMLCYKGVVAEDFQERGAPDYRLQATLTLYEYTQVVIHCVLFCNAQRVLQNYIRLPEMAEDDVAPIPAEIWRWYEKHGKSKRIPVSANEVQYTLLPRAEGYFTRRGLEFRRLTYCNEKYNMRCAAAGVMGKETVQVAYDPIHTDIVYLIEDGEYIPFSLTKSSERYGSASYTEVIEYLRQEKKMKAELLRRETASRVECAGKIKAIADAAQAERGETALKSSLDNMDDSRKKEKEGTVL